MKSETKKAKSKEMFDGLILNAINFLEEKVGFIYIKYWQSDGKKSLLIMLQDLGNLVN